MAMCKPAACDFVFASGKEVVRSNGAQMKSGMAGNGPTITAGRTMRACKRCTAADVDADQIKE
jgi:hypothetical protein